MYVACSSYFSSFTTVNTKLIILVKILIKHNTVTGKQKEPLKQPKNQSLKYQLISLVRLGLVITFFCNGTQLVDYFTMSVPEIKGCD